MSGEFAQSTLSRRAWAKGRWSLGSWLAFAKAAATNGVASYLLVSAASADPGSRMFYSRIKGELDRDVLAEAERTG